MKKGLLTKTVLDATGKKAFLKLPSDLMRELIIKSNSANYTIKDEEELIIIEGLFEGLNELHKTPTTPLLKFHQSLALFLEILQVRLSQTSGQPPASIL